MSQNVTKHMSIVKSVLMLDQAIIIITGASTMYMEILLKERIDR
jgi:hypothetical protein